jgi:hypothetical protein
MPNMQNTAIRALHCKWSGRHAIKTSDINLICKHTTPDSPLWRLLVAIYVYVEPREFILDTIGELPKDLMIDIVTSFVQFRDREGAFFNWPRTYAQDYYARGEGVPMSRRKYVMAMGEEEDKDEQDLYDEYEFQA